MAPSKQDSGDTGVIKLIRRGRTIMKEVRRATSQGIKFEVGWDPDGVPIDPNKQKIVSYIGYLARTDVPITCNWWPNVDDEIKNQIWEKVEVAFEIHPLRKDYVLKEAGALARNFRKILRKKFLDKDGNVIDHPPLSYDLVIDHDVWMEFVDQYKDEEFQKLSEQNRKRVLKPKYPHNLGRTGYACLQQKMLQESGSSETSIPRHRLWKRARVSKKGKINENVEEVLSTCTLTQSASQEELHKRTPDDILGQALKVPEHPGRVRGATFPICQKTFFKKGQKKSIQKETPAEVAQLTDLVKTLQKQVSILLQEREITNDIGAVHYANGRDSCTPNISPVEIHEGKRVEQEQLTPNDMDTFTPLTPNDIPMGTTCCSLCLELPYWRVVAKGKVYNTLGDTIHNCPLPTGYVKVSIDVAIEDDAKLPVPDAYDDLISVHDAIGGLVAWPINLIQLDHTNCPSSKGNEMKDKSKAEENDKDKAEEKDKNQVKPLIVKEKVMETRCTRESVASPNQHRSHIGISANQLNSCTFLNIYSEKVLIQGKQIKIPIDQKIFHDVYMKIEHIGREEVREITGHGELSASAVCVYMRFLFDHCVAENLTEKFAFLSPHRTAHGLTNQSQYISDAIMANGHPNQLYLAPVNIGAHWVLVVINATTGTLFYLDPIHGSLNQRKVMKEMFDNAMMIYRANCNDKRITWSKAKWNTIKCPAQTNYIDCGYYVLSFLKEIIAHKKSTIPQAYFSDCQFGFYDEDQLNEIKEEWATYVLKNFA
ncbi:uncharacterized protein LOC130709958 isoform X2 [Lotus japonicus]|uniref:uncharacterized protein LOC130709958 isoform X2 n=1 Tax=Lotus japonicus TaxID=34305 RepID=UPI0025863072|nr:uncharacterized protein LOC130709958 isoform X2 [Lotus japonicus]